MHLIDKNSKHHRPNIQQKMSCFRTYYITIMFLEIFFFLIQNNDRVLKKIENKTKTRKENVKVRNEVNRY